MKGNQFYLTVTRLLVKAFMFMIFGIVFGLNSNLSESIDNTITYAQVLVDEVITDEDEAIIVESSALNIKSDMVIYTSNEFVAEKPASMTNKYCMPTEMIFIARANEYLPKTNAAVRNTTFSQPRGDRIYLNTS